MKDYPKRLYRGPSYPDGESCRVEDATACAEKLADGWRLGPLAVEAVAEDVEDAVEVDAAPEPSEADAAPTPRKRGRPRKG